VGGREGTSEFEMRGVVCAVGGSEGRKTAEGSRRTYDAVVR